MFLFEFWCESSPLLTRCTSQGVRHRYEAATPDSPTLEKLAINERKCGQREGAACLVRLIR